MLPSAKNQQRNNEEQRDQNYLCFIIIFFERFFLVFSNKKTKEKFKEAKHNNKVEYFKVFVVDDATMLSTQN
jgi:hypothetical protein